MQSDASCTGVPYRVADRSPSRRRLTAQQLAERQNSGALCKTLHDGRQKLRGVLTGSRHGLNEQKERSLT
jgi:hypothetical protein